MNVYTTDKIRNIVLLGHGGAGKTSLVESMAYLSGITSRMGRVEDGNTAACISHTTPMPFLYLPQRQTYLIPR